MPDVNVEWLFAADLDALLPVRRGAAFARVLMADLRDPSILPLLRPAPKQADYLDERRPAAGDRTYFLARRAALRSFAARCLDCPAGAVEIAYTAGGAPQATTPAPRRCFVSVAGRGPAAALAVASRPVGIDFEPAAGMIEPIADVLHDDEKAALAGLGATARSQRFLEIWTAKEAYVKALGLGFNRDPADINVGDGEAADALRIVDRDIPVNLAAGRRLDGRIGDVLIVASCVVL